MKLRSHPVLLVLAFTIFASAESGSESDSKRDHSVYIGPRFQFFEVDSKLVDRISWHIKDGVGCVGITLPVKNEADPARDLPAIQVWLLQKDGRAGRQSSTPEDTRILVAKNKGEQVAPANLGYEFAAPAAASAVGIVLQVEDRFFVYSLISEKTAEQGAH